MPEQHVFIATPCYGGMVTQRYMYSTVGLLNLGRELGFKVSLNLLGNESLITRGRNLLVSRFLDDPTATHLLFIDADIGFDPQQVARMLAFDQDVVAGMYPLKLLDWNDGLQRAVAGEAVETAPLRYVGAPCEGDEAESLDGFVTGTYAGTGFMMIKRAALLRMASAYPQLRYTASHAGTIRTGGPSLSANQYAFFDCMVEPDTGVYLSEDYTFCRLWRNAGGKVWLDTLGALIHVGPHEFHGAPAARDFAPAMPSPLARAA
ncbi:hypothetical protein SAMN06265338_101618 [Rhodoblastus acidophilus]|uniref:Glycosyl transferase family 2 n=1 Tax=Rhodoblastus acidophilus TaxID=1074 RepID=A0A212QJ79_RHOAC|nr:hypothetical protein [Rhodoblastus acidophilus]MCW2316335.1 hypothetical protein [Rhodoblastus acidophilus]PPQ39969.1 hypothetical protein CKO16_03975 [Rhodoblastus acidophilus]RAI23257.1 hypothetical protein CH337_03220 [Rhodoblastus acidophilus]SNB59463.1 hypothetical protein SAMN06265338_101618 [Rhodoblastus acidophilus]